MGKTVFNQKVHINYYEVPVGKKKNNYAVLESIKQNVIKGASSINA